MMFQAQDFEALMNSAGPGMETGAILAMIMAFMVIFIIIGIIAYIYSSFAFMTIGKKLKYHTPWLAWIPFARTAMLLQMGGFPWPLVFLILLPIIGWIALGIIGTIATWRIYEKRNYPGWLALIPLAMVIPYVNSIAGIAQLVVLGLVAWNDRN